MIEEATTMSYEKDLIAIIEGHIKEMISIGRGLSQLPGKVNDNAQTYANSRAYNTKWGDVKMDYLGRLQSLTLAVMENVDTLSLEQKREAKYKLHLAEQLYREIEQIDQAHYRIEIKEIEARMEAQRKRNG